VSDETESAVEQSSEAPVPGPALEPPAQASAAPDPTVEQEPAQIEIGENDPPVFGRMEVPLEDGSGRTVPKIVIRPDAIKNWGRKDQPRKFTPEIAMRIIQYLGGGCYLETAAMAAGIGKVTLHEWINRARLKDGEQKNGHGGGTPELRAWKKELDRAMAMAEARAVSGIMLAGQRSWQAYAWYLERRYPDRWRQKNSFIPENPDGTPVAESMVLYLPSNGREINPAEVPTEARPDDLNKLDE